MGMQSMDRTERFWDGRANEYDRGEDKYQQTYSKTVENTAKHLHGSDVVLDYACGTGIITHELAGHVREIQGIDISSKMIEVASRRAGEFKIENVSYAQATIFDERLEPGAFDAILAFSILHLLEEPQEIMQRISRLLVPGGLFISATPCLGEKRTLLGILMSLVSRTGFVPHLTSLRFSELEGLIADGDFQIVETEDLDQNPPNYFVVAERTIPR
jgi:2-polyprenyl-3-methyl-5-hydroxy-6-metoxy-1,4-benzoquinol methylase